MSAHYLAEWQSLLQAYVYVVFFHLLQHVEGHDLKKKLQLHFIANHTINSSAGKVPPQSCCS